ncbi:MAG: class I SAM-dependent methyltransferase, partial [Gluconacetobacter diazotrophicus]|nr:class I SAM-dependent methyltransferase [Gluconacetobacter diazotrophicus]
YDDLARRHAFALPLPAGARVIDAGCGTGRWLPEWLARGCVVTGIENSPGMVERLAAFRRVEGFTLLRSAMEEAELPPGEADLVLALGSMQYARDPALMLHRFRTWLRPGGTVCLYVDSLVALVLELHRCGRGADADRLLDTRRGTLRHGGVNASMRLYDRRDLDADLSAAGFVDLSFHGLAVGATLYGRDGLAERLRRDEAATMAREAGLAEMAAFVDLGLHILAIGRRPMD